MKRDTESSFRRALRDESGAVAILVAVAIFAFIGFGALAVDVGYLFSAQSALQASAEAAAMAGAADIGTGGTPTCTAIYYSAQTPNGGTFCTTASGTAVKQGLNVIPIIPATVTVTTTATLNASRTGLPTRESTAAPVKTRQRRQTSFKWWRRHP